MEIHVRDEQRLVEVWLSKAEKQDPALREQLKGVYAGYREKKYLVAVFESGSEDLYQNTLDLLAFNKRRCAELAVRRAKLSPQ